MSKRIIVLGAKGMLGHMVYAYFHSHGYDVRAYNLRFTESNFKEYLDGLNALEPSVVVNCIGKIKQKTEEPFSLLLSNSILPLELARGLKREHYLIQPSTDCVFDGRSFDDYEVSSTHTATDVYGWSKSLGEKAVTDRANTLVIRVSIIGPERGTGNGLLAWFLSRPLAEKLNGFTNHYWNGVTTLEWCKFVHEHINALGVINSEVIQLGTEKVLSKYELLLKFREVFCTENIITPCSTPDTVNRALKPSHHRKGIDLQLMELRNFVNSSAYIDK